MTPGRRPAGVALLTVLLIVFLASLTATSLAGLQQLAIRRHTLLQHQQQARLYALGAEQWGMAILERDKDQQVDHPQEEWAASLSRPVEGGLISGQIQDLQACFNLNNLLQVKADATAPGGSRVAVERESLQILQRLLALLELEPGIAQAIADWIDPDQEPRFPDGAEDSDYLERTPPYLAADRPLASVSELRLVKGIDPAIYAKLAPYVCALPPGTPLNVNTVAAPVLAALDEAFDPGRITALLDEERPAQGYRSLEQFLAAAQWDRTPVLQRQLDVKSRYFLIRIEAQVGEARARLSSVVQRTPGRSRVLLRSFGSDY